MSGPPLTRAPSSGGVVVRVGGPVVIARGLRAALYDVVYVGQARLPGEVIRLDGGDAVVQLYEDASGVRAGELVRSSDAPMRAELGPGLLGRIFDGTQRPLEVLARRGEDSFAIATVPRGAAPPVLDRQRTWEFEPTVETGEAVGPGDVLGVLDETPAIQHRVLVPYPISGKVSNVRAGPLRVEEPVASVDGTPVAMLRRRPVRERAPVARMLDPDTPLVTGQRVIDTLFPLARGGTATIPGGFGTGKTVLEHTLAKWSDANVVVYVACGERGNELSEVLAEFRELIDPLSGAPLMDRTIIVANTSNMPVAARESSIYTGITLAEYYRDQGYDVALLADSTSRWGEALREVSSRLEEMPAEEGYPAYLPTRLAEFYGRAGSVVCLGRDARRGSVSIVGAVSPPGGDFSEPVTQHSLRLAGTFWALDTGLARQRHFPAIDWGRSYALYRVGDWFDREVAPGWGVQRQWALDLFQREHALLAIVQLLGTDALAPPEQVVLRTGRLLREDFLQQSSFDERDATCPPAKQFLMLEVIRRAHEAMTAAVARGVDPQAAAAATALTEVGHMRSWSPDETPHRAPELAARIEQELEAL